MKTESQATLAIRRLGRRTPFLGSCKRISREQVHIPPMGNGKSSTQKCLSRGYVIVSGRVIFCWDASTSECNDSFKLRTRTLPHEVANSHLYSCLHSFCVAAIPWSTEACAAAILTIEVGPWHVQHRDAQQHLGLRLWGKQPSMILSSSDLYLLFFCEGFFSPKKLKAKHSSQESWTMDALQWNLSLTAGDRW